MGKIPCRRKWQPHPGFLPGKSHGQRNLVGYSPWSCKESDITERFSTHVSLDPAKLNFVLPLCWSQLLKYVCFLPILQSLTGFLHVLTSHLQRLILSSPGGMPREPAAGCGTWRCLWTSGGWGRLQAGCPSWLMGVFLLEMMR